MKLSQFFLPALKENPSDAELTSHRLMLRSGMIRQLASGLYTWLPLGLRVLHKVTAVVRQEMERAGALELLMPVVQPSELWQDSGRWELYGPELLRFDDRHQHAYCLGPTHEEVITSIIRKDLNSYKQLPLNVFQIQTKFRDEVRPRFGVMRSREFLMKDAYSFHLDKESLQATYQGMHDAYHAIFSRLGLTYRAVEADSGSIGGEVSQEFQVLAASGEDCIAYSDEGEYAANIERATSLSPEKDLKISEIAMERFATPGVSSIDSLVDFSGVAASETVKTLFVHGSQDDMVALVLRGDHELNETKVVGLTEVAKPMTLVDDAAIQQALGVSPGSLGPVNLSVPTVVDRDAAVLINFTCGANEDGHHLKNVNWGRDASPGKVADLRNVVEGDLSPDGRGKLRFVRGIEVGHIFQLGDKYSKAMKATVLDDAGKSCSLLMGCYGIGISRIVAASIEQHHDDRGIIWPLVIAPFQLLIVPVQLHKSYRVREAVEKLYDELQALGVEVLLDDRKERPGVMFATADLIGIPHRIVISERGIDDGVAEYKARAAEEVFKWPLESVVENIQQMLLP